MEKQTKLVLEQEKRRTRPKWMKAFLTSIMVVSFVVMAAAAYDVVTATLNIHVNEAFEVEAQYLPVTSGTFSSWPCPTNGTPVTGPTYTETINGKPLDKARICVIIHNTAQNALPFNVMMSKPSWVTVTPSGECGGIGVTIGAGEHKTCIFDATINDNAPADANGTAVITVQRGT